ncbi:hypothetical protein [Thermococcus sp.]|uniref:hypothetical protein n=1 Tax=Thermococcus sp. TaxID=35749 RepID=UPI00260B39C3|nr:hypothetical protein [Thermococcus sp.]
MRVPYVLFEVRKNGKSTSTFALDAYFIEFLSIEPRKVVLIKDPSTITLGGKAEGALPKLLRKPVGALLKDLYETLLETSGEVREKRVSHMRRWNVWRILGIPTGHSRHVEIDEELAKVEREYSLGLALLERILGVKNGRGLDELEVVERGVLYRKLWLFNGNVTGEEGPDKVYTDLLRIDPVFRTAFFSALFGGVGITEGIIKGSQAFAYSQQAT